LKFDFTQKLLIACIITLKERLQMIISLLDVTI